MTEGNEYPNPCARCGACCVATPCPVAMAYVPGAVKGKPCPALRFDVRNGEAVCLMLLRENFSTEETYQEALSIMGIGSGCCMAGEAVDLDTGLRVPWDSLSNEVKRSCVKRAAVISHDKGEVDRLAVARYN